MFIGFTVGNYRSFRDKQTLDMTAAKGDKPENIIKYSNGNKNGEGDGKVKEIKLLKSAAVYGANASGKSNLIKAIDTMLSMVLRSTDYKPQEKLPVEPFLLDDTSANGPSFFEICFLHNGAKYVYGFTATSERVHNEWLLEQPKLSGKARTLFERVFNTKTKETSWKFSNFLKGEKEKLKSRTRDNVLLLSVGAQWNNDQLKGVYEWFDDKIETLSQSDTIPPLTKHLLEVNREDFREVIVELLKKADLGIEDINTKKMDPEKLELPPDIPEKLKNAILADPPTTVETTHKVPSSNKTVKWSFEKESYGTIRFFRLIGPFLAMIISNQTVFIDELETSLHPLLVRELINFIHKYSGVDYPAQLVFTTHDTTQLDPELFQRDQIWFTEKDRTMATQLYSLVEYKNGTSKGVRKDEALQKGYLSGRYGAIPILESFDQVGVAKIRKNSKSNEVDIGETCQKK